MSAVRREIPLPFYPTGIAALPPGALRLGVPLVHNIVQIGVSGAATRGELDVVTDHERTTTISRTDGSPLQIEIGRGPGQGPAAADSLVLDQAVGSLAFIAREYPGKQTLWYAAGDDLGIRDMENLHTFADILGGYALGKLDQGGQA